MNVIRIEAGSLVLNLCKARSKKNYNTYWVTAYRYKEFNKIVIYTSLYYTKKQAFLLFVKIMNRLLAKKYISY